MRASKREHAVEPPEQAEGTRGPPFARPEVRETVVMDATKSVTSMRRTKKCEGIRRTADPTLLHRLPRRSAQRAGAAEVRRPALQTFRPPPLCARLYSRAPHAFVLADARFGRADRRRHGSLRHPSSTSPQPPAREVTNRQPVGLVPSLPRGEPSRPDETPRAFMLYPPNIEQFAPGSGPAFHGQPRDPSWPPSEAHRA